MNPVPRNQTAERSFISSHSGHDPFNEIELTVVFEHATGVTKRVPAFWAGDRSWRVRFSSPVTGLWHYRTLCSDPADSGLHGREGEIEVVPYAGANPLYRHGPIRVAANPRYFEHRDGTPFFWLGDTWWMGLCRRLSWPGEFQTLAADRGKKGFNVIQIVAGLYPDMPAFDERGANEQGFPWEPDYQRINPRYFDAADRRLQHLADSGLVSCLVACWGYFLPLLGLRKMKQYWRNLVARYGSYPVVWCLAGEGTMPYYLAADPEADGQFQKHGWTELAAYVRAIDPDHHPLTIHPSISARRCVDDPAVLDFDMLQTGHGDRSSLPNTVKRVREAYDTKPVMPVVQGEVCYEGIGEFCRQDVQRLMFWACVLNGTTGFTYGANGIWQVNTLERPFGPSPHGMSWGHTPWQEACQLPGSGQLGLAKRFLARYPWWQFAPHPEWVEPGWTEDLFDLPFTCGRHDLPLAAGIPGKVRIIYQPNGIMLRMVKGLEPGVRYRARVFNPVTGAENDAGEIKPDAAGNWTPPLAGPQRLFPVFHDWVVALEADGRTAD